MRVIRAAFEQRVSEGGKDHTTGENGGGLLVALAGITVGRGVVVTGCPRCRKKFQSINQFVNHLVDDVLPAIADRVVS
jgi:hypothetical protein